MIQRPERPAPDPFFASAEQMQAALAAAGQEVTADLPNSTDVSRGRYRVSRDPLATPVGEAEVITFVDAAGKVAQA